VYDIESDYFYENWTLTHGGLFDFLPNEGPFTYGTPEWMYKYYQVFYAIPPGQAPNQPFTCTPECCGMAGASLDRFQAGVAISDTPVKYTPAIGLPMPFTVRYHQRQTNQPSTFNFSNMGTRWNFGWMSYIAGGPPNSQDAATQHTPEGSQFSYGGYQTTSPSGSGSEFVNEGDFQDNQAWTHATLHYRQGPERYERWLPDGTVEIFALEWARPQPAVFPDLDHRPAGQRDHAQLRSDGGGRRAGHPDFNHRPDGGQLILGYDTANPLLVVSVTRSNDGLSAQFQYTGGQLTSITDTMGITSSFKYASGSNFINSMTTPYGTTTFSSTEEPAMLKPT